MGLLSTKHYHINKTEHVPYAKTVTINEIKAPTDESVRLINEFEDKARKNIIAKIHIDENYLKAIAIFYQEELPLNRVTYHIKFTLNGREYNLQDHIDNFEWRQELSKTYIGLGNEAIFKILHKKFAEIIAKELMMQCPEFLKAVTKVNNAL